MPLLSVVIPTKNRAQFVSNLVSHVLGSSWMDMEVVVIDNDDTDATATMLSSFSDRRLRVVRTGGLNMADNWERGYQEAVGDYIFVVGDKITVDLRVFDEIQKRIKSYPLQQVMVIRLNHMPQARCIRYERSGWGVIDSSKVIDLLLKGEHTEFDCVAPLGYRTILSKEFVRKVQEKLGRITFPISPDYTTAFVTLFMNDQIHHCKLYGNDVIKNAPSNGLSGLYRGSTSKQFLQEYKLMAQDACAYAPLPILELRNFIYSDFFHMARLAGQSYDYCSLDKEAYITVLYEGLMCTHLRYHIDVSEDLQLVYEYMEKNNIVNGDKIWSLIDKYDHSNLKARLLMYIKVAINDYIRRKINKFLGKRTTQ